MSILKFVSKAARPLPSMVQYLVDPLKTDDRGIFGIGVNPCSVISEMSLVQRLYHRENISNPYVQVILSFSPSTPAVFPFLRELCQRVGAVLVQDERQVFGAIHFKDTANVHCHYLINYVGIYGNLYYQSVSLFQYKIIVNQILSSYGVKSIPIFGIMSPITKESIS